MRARKLRCNTGLPVIESPNAMIRTGLWAEASDTARPAVTNTALSNLIVSFEYPYLSD